MENKNFLKFDSSWKR